METPETDLARALRQLAVALADAQDQGADRPAVILRLGQEASPTRESELVEDALLAAGLLLAGSDPHLPLLARVWSATRLRSVAEQLTQELRRTS